MAAAVPTADVTRLREHRETDRRPCRRFEHPVAVAIDQAETGKQRPRPRHIVGPDGDVGGKPRLVPGTDGPVNRCRSSQVHAVGNGLTIDPYETA